jgi:hypothetical protein
VKTLSEAVSHVNAYHEKHNYPADINDSPLASTTPLRAIRRFCVACVGSPCDVPSCGGDQCLHDQGDQKGVCHFYKYRNGRKVGKPSVKLIRKICLECMEDSSKLVAECKSDCHLHRFRFGTNPNITAETREKHREMSLKKFGRGSSSSLF